MVRGQAPARAAHYTALVGHVASGHPGPLRRASWRVTLTRMPFNLLAPFTKAGRAA
jgi:hypothetical protein